MAELFFMTYFLLDQIHLASIVAMFLQQIQPSTHLVFLSSKTYFFLFFFYIDRILKNIICLLNTFIPFYTFTARCERLIQNFFHEENRKIFAGSQPPDCRFSKCSTIPEVVRLCCTTLVLFQHR